MDTVLEVVPPKKPKHRVNYALAATLLAQHLTLDQAAKQCGAKDGNSLRVGLSRRGVTATMARTSDAQINRAVIVAKLAVTEASQALKDKFAGILASNVDKLSEIKPKANLKHIKQLGDALEPLARTAKIVHDWGNESSQGLAMVGLYEQQDQPAITVESTPQPVDIPPPDPS